MVAHRADAVELTSLTANQAVYAQVLLRHQHLSRDHLLGSGRCLGYLLRGPQDGLDFDSTLRLTSDGACPSVWYDGIDRPVFQRKGGCDSWQGIEHPPLTHEKTSRTSDDGRGRHWFFR